MIIYDEIPHRLLQIGGLIYLLSFIAQLAYALVRGNMCKVLLSAIRPSYSIVIELIETQKN